jgi:EipB-like
MSQVVLKSSWHAEAGLAGAVWLVVAGAAHAAAPDAVRIAPHRAVYDMTLARTAPGSGVSDMSGRMVYELSGSACAGYTQNMRFVTRSSASDGSEQLNDMRSETFEETAGRRMRFTTVQYRDEQIGETTRGNADRQGPGGEVLVELSSPERKEMSLPGSVYFPIQHSIALIEAAKAGKSRFAADVYDGSEKGDKVSATNTVIGPTLKAAKDTIGADVPTAQKLSSLKAWPVATSYFEKDKGLDAKDSLPTYEMAFHVYENGVSTRLLMDYGDFALRGELTELTFLDETVCKAAP